MTAKWCDFRKYCAPNLINFESSDHNRDPSFRGWESVRAKKPVKHCPLCDKRLQLKAVYCCGGNCGVDSFTFPDQWSRPRRPSHRSGNRV